MRRVRCIAQWRLRLKGCVLRDSGRQEDAEVLIEIKAATEVARGNYGSPRVHRELRAQGRRIGRKRVERLMRQEAIVAR
jgi:transposase InsO family protein